MKQKIKVIPAEDSHLDEIFRIFYEGFSAKLGFITRKTDLQNSFAEDFNVFDVVTPGREFVALIDNKVMGILSLRHPDLHNPPSQTRDEIRQLIFKYGFSILFKAWLFDLVFRHKYEEGELYIDTLAVSTDARGKGIGTALLDFTENYAKEKGFKKTTLMVIYENPKAQALYERKGYRVTGKHSLKMLKKSTGVSGAYFMEKEIL